MSPLMEVPLRPSIIIVREALGLPPDAKVVPKDAKFHFNCNDGGAFTTIAWAKMKQDVMSKTCCNSHVVPGLFPFCWPLTVSPRVLEKLCSQCSL